MKLTSLCDIKNINYNHTKLCLHKHKKDRRPVVADRTARTVIVRPVTADMHMKILREASGIRLRQIRADVNAMNRAILKVKIRAAITAARAVPVKVQAIANAMSKDVLKVKMKVEIIAAKAALLVNGKIMAVLKIKVQAAIIAAKAGLLAKDQAIVDAMRKDVLKARMKIIAVKAVRDVRPLHKIGSAMNADVLRAKTRAIIAAKDVLHRGQAKAITIRMMINAVPAVRKIAARMIGKTKAIKAVAAKKVHRRFTAIKKTMNAVALKMKMTNTKIKINVRDAVRNRASLNILAAAKAVMKMKTTIIPLRAAIVNRNMLKLAGK
jgi:hypothetical protein